MDRRTFYVDCDDTLIMHNLSAYPGASIKIPNGDRYFEGVPNYRMVGMIKKFFNLGYDVYVWSKTGSSWAREIVKVLQLQPYVKDCLTKPDFYGDDKDVIEWMGPRVYREAGATQLSTANGSFPNSFKEES